MVYLGKYHGIGGKAEKKELVKNTPFINQSEGLKRQDSDIRWN
jgi:hypothetical protein